MRVRRSVLVAVLAWCAVVALGSTLVWAVISRTGGELTQTAGPPPPTLAPSVPTRTGAPGSPSPSRRTSDPTRHPPSTQPTAVPGPTSSAAPPTSPAAPPTSPTAPSTSPAATPTSPTATPDGAPSPPSPAAQPGTWSGAAGLVTVICRGSVIRYDAAQPNPGYRVDVEDFGPPTVLVEFESEARKVQVRATCSAGKPRFTASTETSGEDREDGDS